MSNTRIPILEARGVTVFYGENKVLDDVSFSLGQREILMLVGANGAGKSTLLKALCGMVPLASGEIWFHGRRISPHPARLVRQGIFFVPQDQRVFPEMNVEENIRLGAFSLEDKTTISERFSEVLRMFPSLAKKLRNSAGSLSGGERQIVALARALMTRPAVLLLDEPSVGLAPKIVAEIFSRIREIHDEYDTALVIVEHNLKSLLGIADRALILAGGKVLRTDTPKALLKSRILEDVFFGKRA